MQKAIAIRLDPNKNDAFQVVQYIRPMIQNLIDHGFGIEAIVWAINLNFAELLELQSGSPSIVVDTSPVFTVLVDYKELDCQQRDEAQGSYRQIKSVRNNLLKQGFSYDAVMWALIGAIGNISRGIGLPAEEVEKVTGDMIMRLNAARRTSMN